MVVSSLCPKVNLVVSESLLRRFLDVNLGVDVDVDAHVDPSSRGGSVYCWGENGRGQLGTGDTHNKVSAYEAQAGRVERRKRPKPHFRTRHKYEGKSLVGATAAVYNWIHFDILLEDAIAIFRIAFQEARSTLVGASVAARRGKVEWHGRLLYRIAYAPAPEPDPIPSLARAPSPLFRPVHAFSGLETPFVFQVHPRGLRGAAHYLRHRHRRCLRLRV